MVHANQPNSAWDERITDRMREAIKYVDSKIEDISLVFLTNLRVDQLVDVGPTGIVNAAQHYSEQQADTIILSFQSAGFHVLSYFSEQDFLADALSGGLQEKSRPIPIVFSSAEGGTGAGRRALIPAFCSMMGIAYCNSSAHGCSVARHKYHASSILRRSGLPVPDSWMLRIDGRWIGGRVPQPGTKVIVKPMYESMAIGIDDQSVRIVDDDFQEFATKRSARFGQPLVVQDFITGYEIGVPIIDLDRPLALPIVTFTYGKDKRFGAKPRTFHDENLSNHVGLELYDFLPPTQYRAVQMIAVAAFEALDMSGMGRIDMRLDEDGRPWIFDTNESPPPLAGTSFAKACMGLGFQLEEMLKLWVHSGLRRACGP